MIEFTPVRHMRQVSDLLNSLLDSPSGEFPKLVLEAVSVIASARDGGRKVFVIGNGGSAATASHFSADISKNVEPGVWSMAFDNIPGLTAYSNDLSFDAVFSEQIRNLGEPDDVLFAMSTSGDSANILAAGYLAGQKEMHRIALCGKRDGLLVTSTVVDTLILTPHPSPEVVEDIHSIICHSIVRALKVAK